MNEEHIPQILIVDDEPANVESLTRILKRENYKLFQALNGKEALDIMREEEIDLVITDLMMPKMDGLELLKAIKAISSYTEVIVITAYGSIERAVEVIKEGAYDFVIKPLKRRDIVKTVKKALEKVSLLQENKRLKSYLKDFTEPLLIVGKSPAMRQTMELVRQAAPTSVTVCIQGENGTGKELIAREIHKLSPRRNNKFVAINCGAFPETLLDSELFGFEKNAFTGAKTRKKGRFEMANGGTLFLDEIGELSLSAQVKLLRVIQERTIERLGGTESTPIDIRLLTATNRDLEEEVKAGRFREDLYYRLNVLEIRVPPLRERPDDILILAQHFLEKYSKIHNKPVLSIPPETRELLQNYDWPGNVRQLENVMQRSIILASGPELKPEDLPQQIHRKKTDGNFFVIPFGTPLDEIERYIINETLRRTGSKKLTAQLLGIATRTIYRKIGESQPTKDSKNAKDKNGSWK